eukprot:Skav225897  [mRNA]  locus=scaffold5125:19684:22131:+ [translate_table: standard]
MEAAPYPADTIAQDLTQPLTTLFRHIIVYPDNPVVPSDVEVIWRDQIFGDNVFVRQLGQGLVIWDGITIVLGDDRCGVPLPLDVQTYVANLVRVTFENACPTGGDVEGDPHIKTLDGFHYTLLSQGTFLLWQFSGLSVKVPSKHPMNDCSWRAKKWNGNWSLVEQNQMISIDHDNFATGFVVNPKKNKNNVRLKMSTDDGPKDMAVLSASCRPNHFINLAVAMKRPGDERYVDGELRTLVTRLGTYASDCNWVPLRLDGIDGLFLRIHNHAEHCRTLLQYPISSRNRFRICAWHRVGLLLPTVYQEVLTLLATLLESWKKVSGTMQNASRTSNLS